jgi:hypothetical protein
MAGISIAPASPALAAAPTWIRIDQTYNVQSWSVDRGRQNEMAGTSTGTASLELVDKVGAFDPTNASSPYWGLLEPGVPMGPLVQARIELQNPVSSAWSTLFQGFISQIRWVPYASEQHANVTLELVDALALFAACEMTPDATFGNDFVDGNIVFNAINTTDAVQIRINKVLDAFGWPPALRSLYTGNVKLLKTVYAPRSSVLQPMLDAAQADFPDLARLFVGGPRHPGSVVFRGRLSRFNPGAYPDIQTWQLGDDAAAAANPSTVARISPPLDAFLDDTLLYTSAFSIQEEPPAGFSNADIQGQYVQNAAAVAYKGLRTWSAEGLATAAGATTTGLQETKLFANYIRDNFNTVKVRIGQLTIKSRRPSSVNGPATWSLLCGIDLSDLVHLTTTHGGGGGFGDDFYVEGIHYTARPGGATPYVELTLDVSPKGYYTTNPF